MISVLKTFIEIKKMLATVETKKLLWSNARPNSEFSSQSLSIDGNYDEYIIEWSDYMGENARSSLSLKKANPSNSAHHRLVAVEQISGRMEGQLQALGVVALIE